MLASAALGYTYTPADLYRDFPDIDKYRDGYGGFGDGLFRNKEIMEKLNLTLENENGRPYYEGKAWNEGILMESLEEGKRAIWCTQNKLFTDSGHYIELELKDGKIWLNDPNGANYDSMNPTLRDILDNGCTPEQLKKYGGRYYIFDVANSEANGLTGEKSNEVLMDEILKKESQTPTTPPRTRTTTSSNNTNDATINPKWKSGYLDYSKGILDWNDGQNQIRETWCNYDVRTSDALKFTILALGKDEGYWVREDSAQMFGNKVCIASDIGAWFGSTEGAIFKVGDTCESSFGTGIVMDLCGKSVEARKENRTNSAGQKIDLWFDIYAMPYADASIQSKSYNDSNKYYQSNAGWEDFFRRYPSMKPDTPESVTDWAKYFKDPEGYFKNSNNTAAKTTSTTPTTPTTSTRTITGTRKDFNEVDAAATLDELATKPANATPKTTIGTRTIEQEVNKQNDGDLTNIQPKNNRDIAHRGYTPGGIYDNSAEGFRLAGEKGFWGCETDVRFDADGNLVCSHNAVKNGQNPTSFEEYLDICKEYGMTAIIDLKYEKGVGPADAKLSPTILETIQKKGMMDSCILQTNNPTDIPYIRENSEDARIWYLTDVVSDNNINLINENNVECVNILSSENNAYRIKKLTENGTDVCVWNVQTETSKDKVLNMGAKYVMSDNVLGITPYQEGEEDFNGVNSNLEKDSIKKATTDAEPAPKQTTQTVTQTRIATRIPKTPTASETPTTSKTPTTPTTPTTSKTPTTPAKPTKPAMPETPTKPETPTTPSIPDISEPEDTKLPVMQCTPEAILKAAQNIENTENNSIYICNILYLSGYFTEEEMNMYKNLDISTIFKQIEERGWDKITNTSNLKIGDIIIIDNGEEIRVYAGNNSWYTAGKTEIQKGNENWAEGIEWLAYRPD